MDIGYAIKIVVLFTYVLLIDILSGTPWDQDHTDFITFNPVYER